MSARTGRACRLLLIILASTSLAAPGTRIAQAARPGGTPSPAAIDAFVAAEMQKHQLPGVALAITQGGRVIYQQGYGRAGPDRALTPQTPMYIGSVSKTFTALAIAQLAEQGRLGLDAPVQRYLPWFRVADADASARLTVRHFLHHASGLSDAGFSASLPDDTTLEQAVRALKDARLSALPGTTSQYFNLNYAVLALIIETVAGQPYADYVQAHIFAPLGMNHSYASPEAARANGLAQGYGRFFGVAVPRAQPHRAFELADGYLISTAEDMARFALAMTNGGALGEARVLSAAGVRQLFTPREQAGFRYAMGWFVDDVAGIPRIQHGGANETFKTFVDLYPTRKLGLVLMINAGSMFDHTIASEQLFGGVEQLALGRGRPDPAAGVSVPQIGWALLALVLALSAFQGWQLARLRGWRTRARAMAPRRRALGMSVNFAIPSAILALAVWQVARFTGDRFNLPYQARMLWSQLPDVAILMLVSTVPDYAQGCVKLWWAFREHRRRTLAPAAVPA